MFQNLDAHVSLSRTEAAVLEHLAAGLSDAEIAEVLGITTRAVRGRLQRFYDRTDLRPARLTAAWCGRHLDCCVRERGVG
ncbi:MAG: LuxR C-terminal-related transcriptional regulator [Dehalococcoidia bacterium]